LRRIWIFLISMNVKEKLNILSDAAKYDASCSSSGSSRKGKNGNTASSGICHSWAPDGRCISLLKVLLSNVCIYDCAYCLNRRSNDIRRATFTVDEVVQLTTDFYKRNYIEGLFLSSAVLISPDDTMRRIMEVAKKLRNDKEFGGYIHLKSIPGASDELIQEAGRYADRLSVNIELPSNKSLNALAPDKKKEDIFGSMSYIGKNYLENQEERKHSRKAPTFAPAGQSTQMIIGASPESDRQIVTLSSGLYDKFSLKRVFYSAYIPVNNDSRLPNPTIIPPLLREHRLYQADWLLRFYNFNADEILPVTAPDLDVDFDPKTAWALRNYHQFPIEINKASYESLLRVPGIGVQSAKRIVMARRHSLIDFQHLKKIGVVMKRARFFITCRGHILDNLRTSSPDIVAMTLRPKKMVEDTQLLLKI